MSFCVRGAKELRGSAHRISFILRRAFCPQKAPNL
ncbi:unnamed protein product [Chondrus crispus]|uniref:Uncharacterized protein n=1 Tax=Chondrus crispus TaxID=2769 RepID=R7QS16_CHOCR|nr:unnamed protein product [Chondrus crispus]CDF41282.1 unnamed protein product [Chondrus crispus]|eukprot:XP_005711576.1 unnamed protein product [Chondrus crispus]